MGEVPAAMTDTFGDFDDEDAFDLEPADPEQVARKIHELRLRENLENVEWDRLDQWERAAIITVVVGLLAWLRRQGAH